VSFFLVYVKLAKISQDNATSIIAAGVMAGATVTPPLLLRSIFQSLNKTKGVKEFCFSANLLAELRNPSNPEDPTCVVNKYCGDWWNHLDDEEGYFIAEGEYFEAAFEFHVLHVSCRLLCMYLGCS
jgi:hypothetical protein